MRTLSWFSLLVAVSLAPAAFSQRSKDKSLERFTQVEVWSGAYACQYDFSDKVPYGFPVMLGEPPKATQIYSQLSIHEEISGSFTLKRDSPLNSDQVSWSCAQETGNGTHTTKARVELPGGAVQEASVQSTQRSSNEGDAPPEEDEPSCQGHMYIDLRSRTFTFGCPRFQLDGISTEEGRVGDISAPPRRDETTIYLNTCAGEDLPLPASGTDLSGTYKRPLNINPPLGMPFDDVLSCTVTLRPGPPTRSKLKAVAKASAPQVARGATVELDGSSSSPAQQLRSWEWKFTPGPDCGKDAATPGVRKELKTTVRALCSFTATLTVGDDVQTATDSVQVEVVPRKGWDTDILPDDPKVGRIPGSRGKVPFADFDGKGALELKVAAGANVCAVEKEANDLDAISHRLHPDPFGEKLDGEAYTLEQVNDPDGPFHGWWYVKDYKVVLHRKTLLNQYLGKDGEPPLRGMSNIYTANQELRQHSKKASMNYEEYLEAVLAHEGEGRIDGKPPRKVLGHSAEMKKALKQVDPAADVESMFVPDASAREALVERIRKRLMAAEHHICMKSGDPLPLSWKGMVALPRRNGLGYELVNITVGELDRKQGFKTGCPEGP